jgi:transcriptional regulator
MLGRMLIHAHDAAPSEDAAFAFVESQGFGHLVAAGRGRDVPVVVPTQFVVVQRNDGVEVVLHLARPNPVWDALAENPHVVLSVAGDWTYIPSAWKAIADEDPRRGIPTTYYAAVQLIGRATVVDDPDGVAVILRTQLSTYEPGGDWADPRDAHAPRLALIRGIRIAVDDVRAKFKYGGNVDDAHRRAVADRLAQRDGPGDAAARARVLDSLS